MLKYLIPLFLLCSCGIDRTISPVNSSESDLLSIFRQLPDEHKVKIADDDEPGERLTLCLTFVEKETSKPVSNQEVLFYHTSSGGEYQPTDPSDESTARLNGRARTDTEGRIYVETILPGDYGSSPDNRHIHTTVFGAHPEAYDIHFKQYTGFMGKNFISGSDQHFLADLKLTEGTLIALVRLEIKK
ncbi:MAG: hypothetical protein RIM99_17110 [Cyclobacteriaceae bacterium]